VYSSPRERLESKNEAERSRNGLFLAEDLVNVYNEASAPGTKYSSSNTKTQATCEQLTLILLTSANSIKPFDCPSTIVRSHFRIPSRLVCLHYTPTCGEQLEFNDMVGLVTPVFMQ
jgi:hypothetical protein